jgi:hypothetical protein
MIMNGRLGNITPKAAVDNISKRSDHVRASFKNTGKRSKGKAFAANPKPNQNPVSRAFFLRA